MKSILLTVVFAVLFSSTLVFGQSAAKSENKQTSISRTTKRTDSVYYTCPMHPKVKKNEPGKCTKCGMQLEKKTIKITETKSERHEAMRTYICPMHTKIHYDKPGKCPMCGKNLIKEE